MTCDVLRDLVPFVQFKKREACNFTKSNTSLWMFFTFFKLCKRCPIAQKSHIETCVYGFGQLFKPAKPSGVRKLYKQFSWSQLFFRTSRKRPILTKIAHFKLLSSEWCLISFSGFWNWRKQNRLLTSSVLGQCKFWLCYKILLFEGRKFAFDFHKMM